MRIGYLLLVHEYDCNVRHLIRELLRDSQSLVFVHVDRTVEMTPYIVEDERVIYLKKRYRVTWGGFQMVRATLALIRKAAECKVSYYCLLSGRDFVIHSPILLRDQCENSYPTSYMDGDTVVKRWTERGLDRTKYYFFYIFKNKKIAYRQNRIVRYLGKKLGICRKMPNGLIPYCGSQWWCISDVHMNYLLRYIVDNPAVVRFYKTVGIPDEQFFHTILLNSNYKNQIQNQSPTYVKMTDGIVELWTEQSRELLTKRKEFFARKIKDDQSPLTDIFRKQVEWEEFHGEYFTDGTL